MLCQLNCSIYKAFVFPYCKTLKDTTSPGAIQYDWGLQGS